MIRRSRNRWLALAAGLLAVLVLFQVLPPLFRREPPPASPAALEEIANRNQKAALDAAQVQRRQSEVSAKATDAAISRAEDRGKADAEKDIREADASDTARQAEARK